MEVIENIDISKKIQEQVNAFKSHGFDCSLGNLIKKVK